MADDDERARRAFGSLGGRKSRLLDFNGPVVLGHGFERAQELPALSRDFPAFVIAKHVAAAENIDRRNPACQSLEAGIPVVATGGEDNDVVSEASKRGSAAAVTSQDLQDNNACSRLRPRTATLFVILRSRWMQNIALRWRPSSNRGKLSAGLMRRSRRSAARPAAVRRRVTPSPGFRTRHRSAACRRTASPSGRASACTWDRPSPWR
jgi:hypothetical protein